MDSPRLEYNRLPIENIGQTVDVFFRWLESSQSVLSRYFDHHPSVRRSFLEAVQRVAGRESLLTPVATPAANGLDNDPAVSDSTEHANLTAPVGSTIVYGTVGPFIANNEHLDKSLQEPVDECVEQAGKDDQPYLSAPSAASEDLEAVTPDLESSSHNSPTQAHIVPRQEAKRKRVVDGEIGALILSKLPRNILEKWNRIASPEDLAQLRLDICAKRRSPSDKKAESTLETSDPSDTSIEGQLKRYQLQYQRGVGALKEYKKFVEVPWRLYLANIISLYIREKAARKKERRKRNRGRNIDAANTPRKSVYNIFVEFLLPELQKKDGDIREEANRSSGILLLIPHDLSNDNLRNLILPEVDALVEYLDSYRPALKTDIQNLTSLLSLLVEDRCLLDQRLKLEMLSESQITSQEHATQSLKELFEYSDDYSSFLIETARSDLSQPITETSPYPLVNLEEQADGSVVFDEDDRDLTYTKVLFLSSPVDAQDMDRLWEEVP